MERAGKIPHHCHGDRSDTFAQTATVPDCVQQGLLLGGLEGLVPCLDFLALRLQNSGDFFGPGL